MRRSWKAGVLVVLLSGAGLWLGVTRPAPAHAGAASQPAPSYDPKKKKPGDVCKTSDECQRHHTCTKVGDKNVCQAPPPPVLPPGVVT